MTNNIIITVNDIKQFRPMADLVQSRVDPYILEAQENDLRPVLNDALYYDMLSNLSAAKYDDLVNGKTYAYNGQTIRFDGIKPMLAYHSLARIVLNNQLNITSFGVVQKTTGQSTPSDAIAIKMQVTELRSLAASYQEKLLRFLESNQSTYPLWKTMERSATNTTGLKFFRA